MEESLNHQLCITDFCGTCWEPVFGCDLGNAYKEVTPKILPL